MLWNYFFMLQHLTTCNLLLQYMCIGTFYMQSPNLCKLHRCVIKMHIETTLILRPCLPNTFLNYHITGG